MNTVAAPLADYALEPAPSESVRTDVVEYGMRRVLVTVAVILGAVVEIIAAYLSARGCLSAGWSATRTAEAP